MDFLDPKKRRRRDIFNIVGYGLIAIALAFAVRLLFYQASGFGIDKAGKVVQSGLVFAASNPGGAQVRINGVLDKAQTNSRISLVSGNYNISFSRDGYRSWQQTVDVTGGQIVRLDYATLFPTQLKTTTVKKYDGTVSIVTQSPDRRWLLASRPGSDTKFDVYDLKNPKLISTELVVPTELVTAGTTTSWKLDEWSSDNQHVLLSHIHDGITEFILVDRSDGAKSVNLSTTLGANATKISLLNKRYDSYYVFDAAAQTLETFRLGDPGLKPYLTDVLEYQSYGSNIMLYASSKTTTPGKVGVVLLMGDKSYFLREVSGNTQYLLNLTQYSNDWYVAIGASSENKVYVYKNPDAQLNSSLGFLVPVSVLKTTGPTKLSFSNNARFIMDENGSKFSVYDAEVGKSYQYDTKLPLDVPQLSASWMDGSRLTYVSNGTLIVFDFNHTNTQKLVTSDPAQLPFFLPDYKHLYNLQPLKDGSQALSSTALRTPADL